MKPEQITAWALDEASAEERQQLEAALLENPQQKQTAEETKAFCDFLLSELRDDSLALTDAQRERLVGQSSRVPAASETPAPQPAPRPPQTKWNIGIIVRLAVAACVALGGLWTWQAYTLNQRTSHVVAAADAPSIKVNLPQAPEAKKKLHEGAETRLLASAPVKTAIKEQPPSGKPLPAAPMPAPVAAPVALALSKRQSVMTPGDVEKLKRIQDQNAYALNFGDQMAAPTAVMPGLQAQKSELAEAANASSLKLPASGGLVELGTGGVTLGGTVTPAYPNAVVPPRLSDPMQSVANILSSAGPLVVNGVAAAPLGKNQTLDLVGAPTVTTKSGTQAAVAGSREFAYPSELGIAPILPGKPMPTQAAGTVDLRNSQTYTGSTTITGGTLALTTVVPAPSAMAAAAGRTSGIVLSSTFDNAGANSLTVGQSVSGTALPMNALGKATFGAANTYSGGTTINGGVATPPAGPAPSGQLVFSSAAANAGANALGANVGVIQADAGAFTLGGGTTSTGAITLAGGTLTTATAAPVKPSFAFSTVDGTTSAAPAQGMSGAGANLTVNSGTLAATVSPPSAPSLQPGLSGSGMNDIQQLTLGAQTNLAQSNLAPNSNYDTRYGLTSLDMDEAARVATAAMSNPATAPLAGTGDVVITSGSSVVNGRQTATSINGGAAARTQVGAGAVTLGGGTAYTGATTVNAGTLSMGASISSGDLMVHSAQGVPTQMQRSAGGMVTLGGGTLAIATPAAAPAQGNSVAGGTYNVNNGTYVDLNEPGRVSTVTVSNAATAPQNSGVIGGWAVVDGSKSAGLSFGSTRVEQKPQSAATSANSLSIGPAGTGTGKTEGTTIASITAPATPPTSYSTANTLALQGNSAATTFFGASGVVSTSSAPALAPGAPISNPQPDTRYFASVGDVQGYATKDMAQKQEAPAFRRSDVSGESYTHIIENELKDVAREPLSTLSIDVDTASYANVRRFLNQGMIPPLDAVRIEELVNYFPTTEEGPAHEVKEPFGVRIELAPCPWQPVHRLARIAIKGRERDKDRKPSNLVFLVDVSGSMNEPAKLPLVQQSLRMLTEQLGEGDRVTMVVYAGSSGVVLPPTNGEKKAEILAAIDRLSAGGSTHGSAGLKLAYEQAVAGFIKGGVNRVILCTDGDFNVGVSSPEELEKLIKHKAKTGVFLSVLGFGSGNLQDRTMETLADKGNGNYAYIDSLSEARKVLVEQMGGTLDTIAKDVKIQVEFNPAAVRSYRLIGYENRLLAKEDFNDDTKDAGEIGAGHSVVALYEIVPANLPPGTEPRPAVDSLKYQAPAISPAQLAEAAKSGEMMTVKLRYKEPDSDLSKLIEVPTKDAGKTLTASSDEFKFSAAVASFGLLLRDSSYKGTLSWETVRRLALDGKGADTLGYRGEFLQLIDKARGLKETK